MHHPHREHGDRLEMPDSAAPLWKWDRLILDHYVSFLFSIPKNLSQQHFSDSIDTGVFAPILNKQFWGSSKPGDLALFNTASFLATLPIQNRSRTDPLTTALARHLKVS
jgi:hypothetical protein